MNSRGGAPRRGCTPRRPLSSVGWRESGNRRGTHTPSPPRRPRGRGTKIRGAGPRHRHRPKQTNNFYETLETLSATFDTLINRILKTLSNATLDTLINRILKTLSSATLEKLSNGIKYLPSCQRGPSSPDICWRGRSPRTRVSRWSGGSRRAGSSSGEPPLPPLPWNKGRWPQTQNWIAFWNWKNKTKI